MNDAETLWEPLLQGTGAEDEYWDWVAKSRRATLLPGDELYAIECDGVTQGLMTIDVLKKRCQIESQLRRRLVYIRALATAPWNRPAITNPPTYKGVGGNLIDFAFARSYELGYQGRIGLHALPDALLILQKAEGRTARLRFRPRRTGQSHLCMKPYGKSHDSVAPHS